MGKISWQFCDVSNAEAQAFSSFSKTWCYEGQRINENLVSKLTKVEVGGQNYYIKAYKKSGRSIRRYIGRSRIRAEWENLQMMAGMGIPTAELVVFGEETKLLGDRKGIVVTRERQGTMDLDYIANHEVSILQQRKWREGVVDRLARYVRTMHDHRFIHGDLKWRNILVNPCEQTDVYMIDCPQGRQLNGRWLNPVLDRGKIKDLACLDKVAKYSLSRTQRLRFYLLYAGLVTLNQEHKDRIRQILSFFKGRE